VEHHRNHETMRREQAAVKIQSRVRGVQCRRLGAKRPKQRKVAATKLEAYSAHPRVQVDWHCEQEKAAVRIQARQRGVRDRRKVKMEQERRHGAAVKIQARQRGLCERQRLREEQERRHGAAVKIQARQRGLCERHRLREERERRHGAAVKIQARQRGLCERHRLREERERRQGAAVKIQSRVRGWRGRQQARGLERERDHRGACGGDITTAVNVDEMWIPSKQTAKETGSDGESVVLLKAELKIENEAFREIDRDRAKVVESDLEKQEDRTTEKQEKVQEWREKGRDSLQDKDRVIWLEKELKAEKDLNAEMQQRMEKGCLLLLTPMFLHCSCLPH